MVEPLMKDLIGGLYIGGQNRCHYVLDECITLYFDNMFSIRATDDWKKGEFTLHRWHIDEHIWD